MTDEMIFWGLAALAVLSFIGAVVFTVLDIRESRQRRRAGKQQVLVTEKAEEDAAPVSEKSVPAEKVCPDKEDETAEDMTGGEETEEKSAKPNVEELLKHSSGGSLRGAKSGESRAAGSYNAKRIDDLIGRLK